MDIWNLNNMLSLFLILILIMSIIPNYKDIKKLLGLDNKESFTSQYSSLHPNLSNTVKFDTNYYLRESNKVIKINNHINLPIIKYALTANGTYESFVGKYFRKHIYPIEPVMVKSSLDIIYKFISGDIDIAFINEELLTRFIKRDCKYLTAIIKKDLGITELIQDNEKLLDIIYPKLNISAIGIGYHQDFYLIVSNFSNIVNFPDIKNKNVGVWSDSYYDFVKLCAAWGLNLVLINPDIPPDFNLTIEEDINELINKFTENKYDAIFIVCHPKNQNLLDLTLNNKIRLIHLQKRMEIGSKTPTSAIINSQQGSGGGFFNMPTNVDPKVNSVADFRKYYSDEKLAGKTRKEIVELAKSYDINSDLDTIFDNKQVAGEIANSIYKKYKNQISLHYNLVSNDDKESFNEYIKKFYRYLFPRSVDLTKFYRVGNLQTYLETYSQRVVLIVRNEIPKTRIEYLTHNYISSLEKMRDNIDIEQYNIDINNISSDEFKYDELLSFNQVIPLNDGARSVYIKEGLIYTSEDNKCDI